MESQVVVLSPHKGDKDLHNQVINHLLRGKPGREVVVVLEPAAVVPFRKALNRFVKKRYEEALGEERKRLKGACQECGHVFVGDLDALARLKVGQSDDEAQPVAPPVAKSEGILEDHPLSRAARARRHKNQGIDERALSDAFGCFGFITEGMPASFRYDPFAHFCLLELLDELSRIVLLLRLFDDSFPKREKLVERIIAASDLEGDRKEEASALLRRLVKSAHNAPCGPFPLGRLYPLRRLLRDLDYFSDYLDCFSADLLCWLDRFLEDDEGPFFDKEGGGTSALKGEEDDG